jgi:hypothetical protein
MYALLDQGLIPHNMVYQKSESGFQKYTWGLPLSLENYSIGHRAREYGEVPCTGHMS